LTEISSRSFLLRREQNSIITGMDDLSSISAAGTSTSLLQRVRTSDPQAWRKLADVYGPLVYAWARQTGLQEADAADVLQETFRSVFARIGSFRKERPADSFRGWLWTITRNKIRDHWRGAAGRAIAVGGTDQRLALEALPEVPPESSTDSGFATADAYLSQKLLPVIQAEFEPRTWQAFWQVTIENRRAADVAAELQMSVGAVYMAKSRVLKRLRQELSE
jgi:RNA polymerase sigma-70 factor (ECF subfamily)